MVDALVAQNERLMARVAELERLLGRHSGVSGKPPSSDTLGQRDAQNAERQSRAERRRAARAKAKELMRDKASEPRRPGKQPGGEGKHLEMVDDPDEVVEHRPGACSGCGGDLAGSDEVGVERRQVFDLPQRRFEVVEHRALSCRCACGTTTKAPFPAVARATTAYGPLVRALGVYLVGRQHLPIARAAELLEDALGAPVSTGWLAGLTLEAAAGLEPFLAELRAQLVAADVLHADETGARIAGARWWFHVACTDLLTLLDCHERRGAEAFSDMGVLPFLLRRARHRRPEAVLVDRLAEHALCCAHLLRDLASVAQIASQTAWADAMADLLVEAKHTVEAAGPDGLGTGQLGSLRRRYTRIVKAGWAANPDRTGKRDSLERESYNLLRRFDLQRADICRHWANPAIPFDNNQAERGVRMVKLQQKISGCFRTPAGARAFCAVRSYIQTANKHGVGLLEALTRLFNGDPWIPPTPSRT